MMGRPIDVVETSRGCTFDCSFCSIIEMRGRNFHRFADRARDRRHHATPATAAPASIFIVDDNITIDVPRFESAVPRDRRAGLDDLQYLVQAMTAVDRAAWRNAGAADAAGRIPLRLPRASRTSSKTTSRS